MKKNFKPNTWLYPQPVLVIASYGADGTADGMVAAWGGIYDTNQVGFMLDHTHKTVANLLEKKAFTVWRPFPRWRKRIIWGLCREIVYPIRWRALDFMR